MRSKWNYRNMTSSIATVVAILISLCQAPLWAEAQSPVNPHAAPEARALLDYIYSISGKYILTGQHNYPDHR